MLYRNSWTHARITHILREQGAGTDAKKNNMIQQADMEVMTVPKCGGTMPRSHGVIYHWVSWPPLTAPIHLLCRPSSGRIQVCSYWLFQEHGATISSPLDVVMCKCCRTMYTLRRTALSYFAEQRKGWRWWGRIAACSEWSTWQYAKKGSPGRTRVLPAMLL